MTDEQIKQRAAEIVKGWLTSDLTVRDLVERALREGMAMRVPDERVWRQAAGRDDYQYTKGWNACRAAMLKPFPNA